MWFFLYHLFVFLAFPFFSRVTGKHHRRKVKSDGDDEVEQPSTSKNDTTIHILIFLPRAYHLLMKFNIEETHTLITLKTDYWRVLTYIDSYLEDILKK